MLVKKTNYYLKYESTFLISLIKYLYLKRLSTIRRISDEITLIKCRSQS